MKMEIITWLNMNYQVFMNQFIILKITAKQFTKLENHA